MALKSAIPFYYGFLYFQSHSFILTVMMSNCLLEAKLEYIEKNKITFIIFPEKVFKCLFLIYHIDIFVILCYIISYWYTISFGIIVVSTYWRNYIMIIRDMVIRDTGVPNSSQYFGELAFCFSIMDTRIEIQKLRFIMFPSDFVIMHFYPMLYSKLIAIK